jgi:hypothetical protein
LPNRRGNDVGDVAGGEAPDFPALVGHEPHLSQLAAWLTLDGATHEAIARADLFRLQKGGVVHLAGDLRPGGMTLIGFLPPRLLERIGS